MSANPDFLFFDIDEEEIKAIQKIIGATDEQVKKAHNRALGRTANTLKSLTNKLVKDEMRVRNLKALRQRFQSFRVKASGKNQLNELRFWFGLNDLKVSDLRGRMARIGSKKKPKGARFRPHGNLPEQVYGNGFVTKVRGVRSIWARTSKRRYPIKEQTVPIADNVQVMVEDDIFERLPEIYLRHFEVDLKGRVKLAEKGK
ncbi:phage tail protein [Vibrio furnissii]|uniref:phage tail protein n=1 Tax=Vibrio furnissii TaxID=29494 RepID=UPI0012AE6EB5|nr:phage tail protein [Vibrio furnissii]